jgi:hypothetical protein
VSPAAIDTWNDGVDSDCGNGDAPACPALEAGTAFPRVDLELGACEGADLHLLDLALCGTACARVGTYHFMVTNTGAESSPAGLSVSWIDNQGARGSLTLPALAPGKASDAFAVPVTGEGFVSVELDFDDCSPADTQLTKEREYSRCLR